MKGRMRDAMEIRRKDHYCTVDLNCRERGEKDWPLRKKMQVKDTSWNIWKRLIFMLVVRLWFERCMKNVDTERFL